MVHHVVRLTLWIIPSDAKLCDPQKERVHTGHTGLDIGIQADGVSSVELDIGSTTTTHPNRVRFSPAQEVINQIGVKCVVKGSKSSSGGVVVSCMDRARKRKPADNSNECLVLMLTEIGARFGLWGRRAS